ncbi:MAG: hypothetical protein AAF715_32590, partial [Myxococcota bacterium]
MTITASLVPAYPTPAHPVAITLSGATAGNVVRVRCVGAPRGSELFERLQQARQTTTETPTVAVTEVAAGDTWRVTFDRAGAYAFEAQEFTAQASAFGGGYQDDPSAAASRTAIGSEDAFTVFVSQPMTVTLRSRRGDAATLRLHVNDATIRATTPATHGSEAGYTPRIEGPFGGLGRLAEDASTVNAQLRALEDVTVTAAFDVSAVLLELRAQMIEHFDAEAPHDATDESNVATLLALPSVAAELADVSAIAEAARRIGEALANHARNLDASGAVAESPYHTSATWAAVPAGPQADDDDVVAAYLAISDLRRRYTEHIA